jgi:hypothetical protein
MGQEQYERNLKDYVRIVIPLEAYNEIQPAHIKGSKPNDAIENRRRKRGDAEKYRRMRDNRKRRKNKKVQTFFIF